MADYSWLYSSLMADYSATYDRAALQLHAWACLRPRVAQSLGGGVRCIDCAESWWHSSASDLSRICQSQQEQIFFNTDAETASSPCHSKLYHLSRYYFPRRAGRSLPWYLQSCYEHRLSKEGGSDTHCQHCQGTGDIWTKIHCEL